MRTATDGRLVCFEVKLSEKKILSITEARALRKSSSVTAPFRRLTQTLRLLALLDPLQRHRSENPLQKGPVVQLVASRAPWILTRSEGADTEVCCRVQTFVSFKCERDALGGEQPVVVGGLACCVSASRPRLRRSASGLCRHSANSKPATLCLRMRQVLATASLSPLRDGGGVFCLRVSCKTSLLSRLQGRRPSRSEPGCMCSFFGCAAWTPGVKVFHVKAKNGEVQRVGCVSPAD